MDNETAFEGTNHYEEIAKAIGVELYKQYTTAQVVKALNISRSTVDHLRYRGQLGYIRVTERGMPRFWGWQLCEYLVEQTVCRGMLKNNDFNSETGIYKSEMGSGIDVTPITRERQESEYHCALETFKKPKRS